MPLFFATCPKSIEPLLAEELASLGATEIKQTRAGVYFDAELPVAYRACLWSRLANHILFPLLTCPIHEVEGVYFIAKGFDWAEHMSVNNTFAIDVDLIQAPFKNAQYVTQRFKDGLVDHWRDKTGKRPSVATQKPDLRFHVLVKKNELTLSLNLSGESLHRRNIRTEKSAAPLKENLAAAILIRAAWPKIAEKNGGFFDPLCGSGTLLIEAAMMAGDIAPGLFRDYFGFLQWQSFKPAVWKKLLEEAKDRREQGLKNLPKIIGYDGERASIRSAQENIQRAGLSQYIHVERQELSECKTLSIPAGLVLTNPPYGERLGEKEVLKFTYQHLGEIFKDHFQAWQCSVFTGNPDLAKALKLGPENIYSFFNGTIPCQLLNFIIRPSKTPELKSTSTKEIQGGEDFANRLKKNIAKLATIAKKENVSCYRLYDADLPDYAVAIDRYEDFIHLQEYAPPKSIDPAKAEKRLALALQHTAAILGIPPKNVFLKTRKKQSGKNQYQRAEEKSGALHTIHEFPAKFLVNFTDYLDTGLFLDSRLVRKYILEHSAGKTFLNLFCYTGAASVAAALGKAVSTTSVDMSATYLTWAKRNLALNGVAPNKHEFIQADCLSWLKEPKGKKFDLILLDPPTFSNSKRMTESFDVERDQLELIKLAMQRLTKNGTLIFVTNKSNFKLDEKIKMDFVVEEITEKTLPFDFKRYKIHRSFLIRHKN